MVDILVILILIFFNGFFSLAEVSLISAKKSRIEAMAKEGSRNAQAALKLMNDPDRFLSTAQVGITIVSILTGLFSGEEFAGKFGNMLISTFSMDAAYAYPTAQIIILILVTYLSCELGELFPSPRRSCCSSRGSRCRWYGSSRTIPRCWPTASTSSPRATA